VRRPLVGLTAGTQGGRSAILVLREEYARAVDQAGGIPIILPPTAPEDAPAALDRLDAVLFTGGGDIDPAFYGAARQPRLGRVDRDRDVFELALARASIDSNVPLLGVCRGLQLLNVATGGSLHQDIPSELGGALDHRPKLARYEVAHAVTIAPGSLLHRVIQHESMDVNSIHHQAIDRLGKGLVVSARSADGLVEAVEMPSRAFVLAVQWHPESVWDRGLSFGDLFRPLVEAAADWRQR
jgi:putative glutamine amidotransferase